MMLYIVTVLAFTVLKCYNAKHVVNVYSQEKEGYDYEKKTGCFDMCSCNGPVGSGNG